MGQICLILQGVVVGQWLLLTYRQSLLASPGNVKQCILPLPLSFFKTEKEGLKREGLERHFLCYCQKYFSNLEINFFCSNEKSSP